jgi:hypothetical protein
MDSNHTDEQSKGAMIMYKVTNNLFSNLLKLEKKCLELKWTRYIIRLSRQFQIIKKVKNLLNSVFKNHLPIARIKKIMKTNNEVKVILTYYRWFPLKHYFYFQKPVNCL